MFWMFNVFSLKLCNTDTITCIVASRCSTQPERWVMCNAENVCISFSTHKALRYIRTVKHSNCLFPHPPILEARFTQSVVYPFHSRSFWHSCSVCLLPVVSP